MKKLVNGKEVKLTAEEQAAMQAQWKANEEADAKVAYIPKRIKAYGTIGEQLDRLWHDIDNGTLDQTGEFYISRKKVKDAIQKPE